jgi:serine/threonine-protein kinase
MCRHHIAAGKVGELRRCPNDRRIMVHPPALAAADGDPFLGLVVGGRFAVLEKLGAGSMGTVYRARHEAMARDVALKVVRSERLADANARRRFQQEAQAMSMLKSAHTVTVYDFGVVEVDGADPHQIGGSLYLAMELLHGEALGKRLKRGGRIPVPDAVRVLRQALTSLSEAHEKGVIHRDLKPDNLLLVPGEDGETTKVLDFGIAKLLTGREGIDALETQAGTVFGTPRYMSPEQAQGKKLDARSDLYSLGVILYHMLLGRPPYTDGDAVVVMAHHIKTVPKRPSEVAPDAGIPAELEDLLMRVLSKSPNDRPQSAAVFIEELDNLPAVEPVAQSAELAAVLGRQPEARTPRKPWAAMAGVALVAVTAVAAVVLLRRGDDAGLRNAAHYGVSDTITNVVHAAEARVAAGPPERPIDVEEPPPEPVEPVATAVEVAVPETSASSPAPSSPPPSAMAPQPRVARTGSRGTAKPPPPKKGYTKFDR